MAKEKETRTLEMIPTSAYRFINTWGKEEYEFFFNGSDGIKYITFTTSKALIEKLAENIGKPIVATFDIAAHYNLDFDAYRIRGVKIA